MMKNYVIVSEYPDGYDILGLFDDKDLAITHAKVYIEKHKISIDVRKYELNTFSDDGISIYSAYWCYRGFVNKSYTWTLYERLEGVKYIKRIEMNHLCI